MNINFGLIPEFDQRIRSKQDRGAAISARALASLDAWINQEGVKYA